MGDNKGRGGRPYRTLRASVLADSRICWICGHGGADVAEHVKSLINGGSLTNRSNLRPAHGVNRCPTCGRNCNGEKGSSLDVDVFRPDPHSRDW